MCAFSIYFTFVHLGKDYCDSQQIPEDILIEKTCDVLGINLFDEKIFHERIKAIIVPQNNTLVYVFTDGTEKRVEWKHKSRRDSWTPEMREAARQRTLAQNAKRRKEKNNGTQSTD